MLQQGEEIDMPTVSQCPDKLPDLEAYLSSITTGLFSAERRGKPGDRRASGDPENRRTDLRPRAEEQQSFNAPLPGTRGFFDWVFPSEHSPSPVRTEPVNAVVRDTNSGETQNTELQFGQGLICVWSNTTPSRQVFDEWPKPCHIRNDPKGRGSSNTEVPALTLGDCFDEFSRIEKFERDEAWLCPGPCQTLVPAQTAMHLWRVPEILIIQLKRLDSARNCKVDAFVDFPVTNLDLTDRVGDKDWLQRVSNGSPLVYDLFAVANHSGGLHGGHWTANVRNYLENPSQWYHFNGFLMWRISLIF